MFSNHPYLKKVSFNLYVRIIPLLLSIPRSLTENRNSQWPNDSSFMMTVRPALGNVSLIETLCQRSCQVSSDDVLAGFFPNSHLNFLCFVFLWLSIYPSLVIVSPYISPSSWSRGATGGFDVAPCDINTILGGGFLS